MPISHRDVPLSSRWPEPFANITPTRRGSRRKDSRRSKPGDEPQEKRAPEKKTGSTSPASQKKKGQYRAGKRVHGVGQAGFSVEPEERIEHQADRASPGCQATPPDFQTQKIDRNDCSQGKQQALQLQGPVGRQEEENQFGCSDEKRVAGRVRLVKNDGIILNSEYELSPIPVERVSGQEGRCADQEKAQQAAQRKEMPGVKGAVSPPL